MKLNTAACIAALVMSSGVIAYGATIATSNDLDFIVGSGSNLSVLVIDFNDGTSQSSFAWGYRWDGTATGQDLLQAVSDADSNLTFDSTSFVQTINYFDGTTQHSGVSDFGADLSFTYALAGGFANTFNDMFEVIGDVAIENGGIDLPTEYTLSPSGTAGRTLADGSWDALSFGPFPTLPGPEAPQAALVPEPSVTGLFTVFLLFGVLRRKR